MFLSSPKWCPSFRQPEKYLDCVKELFDLVYEIDESIMVLLLLLMMIVVGGKELCR